jgi:25S rRNA (adenine2142-N1)-methyltransferase
MGPLLTAFLQLPLPCVINSRYLTIEHMKLLMNSIGFEEIKDKWKKGSKMAYWLYRKRDKPPSFGVQYDKKTVLRGGNRNNFVILV